MKTAGHPVLCQENSPQTRRVALLTNPCAWPRIRILGIRRTRARKALEKGGVGLSVGQSDEKPGRRGDAPGLAVQPLVYWEEVK